MSLPVPKMNCRLVENVACTVVAAVPPPVVISMPSSTRNVALLRKIWFAAAPKLTSRLTAIVAPLFAMTLPVKVFAPPKPLTPLPAVTPPVCPVTLLKTPLRYATFVEVVAPNTPPPVPTSTLRRNAPPTLSMSCAPLSIVS